MTDDRRISKNEVIIVLCVGFIILSLFIYWKISPQKSQEPVSKEQIRKELIEKNFSSWDGSHRGLEDYIKKNMNDPKSYEHVETRYFDRGEYLLVLTTFRGKNTFGGVVKNQVRAKVGLNGEVLEINDMN